MHAYAAISYISHMSPVVIKRSLLQLATAKCLLYVSNGGAGVLYCNCTTAIGCPVVRTDTVSSTFLLNRL